MKFPPTFSLTDTIKQLVYNLDVLKSGYELHPVTTEQAINLRRASLLKSSLFSARIEGNPLDLADLSNTDHGNGNIQKTEIFNLVASYEQLSEFLKEPLTIDMLKKFHQSVLRDISGDAGHLRMEESAIYNQAGIAVYLTPAPQSIRSLLDGLCMYVNETKDSPPVAAGVVHIWFEKIHPFLDGNGRVGRLLSALVLKKGGYDFSGLVPFEQYLDEHRDDYYYF